MSHYERKRHYDNLFQRCLVDNVTNLWLPIILNGADIVLAYEYMFTYLHPNTHEANKNTIYLHIKNDVIVIYPQIFVISVKTNLLRIAINIVCALCLQRLCLQFIAKKNIDIILWRLFTKSVLIGPCCCDWEIFLIHLL